MKKPLLVKVTWYDAASSASWNANPEVGLTQCETVGWLVSKKTDSITVAGERSNAGHWANRTTIPRSTVVKVEGLR